MATMSTRATSMGPYPYGQSYGGQSYGYNSTGLNEETAYDPHPFRTYVSSTPDMSIQVSPFNEGSARINLFEKPDRWEITADVPGCRKEDVNVDVNNGLLCITANCGTCATSECSFHGAGGTRPMSMGTGPAVVPVAMTGPVVVPVGVTTDMHTYTGRGPTGSVGTVASTGAPVLPPGAHPGLGTTAVGMGPLAGPTGPTVGPGGGTVSIAPTTTIMDRPAVMVGQTGPMSGGGAGAGKWCHLERKPGALTRSIKLPPSADLDRINAKVDNGVLCITVSKRPESAGLAPRRIPIA